MLDPTPGLQRPDFLACARNEATHWNLPARQAWGRSRIDVILARSEEAPPALFDPKAPAAYVQVGAGLPQRTDVSGGLPRNVILKELRAFGPRVRSCYELRLGPKPNLEGKVAVAFIIGPEGDVIEAELAENTTGDVPLGDCVRGVVKQIKFQPPQGGGNVKVTFPWIFRPVDTDPGE